MNGRVQKRLRKVSAKLHPSATRQTGTETVNERKYPIKDNAGNIIGAHQTVTVINSSGLKYHTQQMKNLYANKRRAEGFHSVTHLAKRNAKPGFGSRKGITGLAAAQQCPKPIKGAVPSRKPEPFIAKAA